MPLLDSGGRGGERVPVRTQSRRRRPDFRPRIDAGGRRARQQDAIADRQLARQAQEAKAASERAAAAAAEKLAIPLLEKLTDLRHVNFKAKKPEYPAYQVSPELPLDAVFKHVFAAKRPNRMSTRHGEASVGAHFDHYYESFEPWTVHHNIAGAGLLRAAFLSDELFAQYRQLGDQEDKSDETMQALAAERETIGQLYIAKDTVDVYEGSLSADTRTLLWHGRADKQSAPPAIHDFQREGLGSYVLYAVQTSNLDMQASRFTEI